MPNQIHEGRNIKRIREMLGVKQEALAIELGEDWSQKKISQLETKETIEPELLEQVANALKVPVEAIRNFNEDAAVNYINTFNESTIHDSSFNNFHCNFNPLDKVIELYESKIELYERMLKEKDALIEKLMGEKK